MDELIRLSDAQKLLGDRQKALYLRQEALDITLEVGMLWPGLTEMLVVDDGVCGTITSLNSTTHVIAPQKSSFLGQGATYKCVRTNTTSYGPLYEGEADEQVRGVSGPLFPLTATPPLITRSCSSASPSYSGPLTPRTCSSASPSYSGPYDVVFVRTHL